MLRYQKTKKKLELGKQNKKKQYRGKHILLFTNDKNGQPIFQMH